MHESVAKQIHHIMCSDFFPWIDLSILICERDKKMTIVKMEKMVKTKKLQFLSQSYCNWYILPIILGKLMKNCCQSKIKLFLPLNRQYDKFLAEKKNPKLFRNGKKFVIFIKNFCQIFCRGAGLISKKKIYSVWNII